MGKKREQWIIATAGAEGVGKTTVAEMARDIIGEAAITPMADPLKNFCFKTLDSLGYDITRDHFDNHSLKDKELSELILIYDDMVDSFNTIAGIPDDNADAKLYRKGLIGKPILTPRDMLLRFGSDYCRKIDSDFWVEIWKDIARDWLNMVDVVIMPDMRFENEEYALDRFNKHGCNLLFIQIFKRGVDPEKGYVFQCLADADESDRKQRLIVNNGDGKKKLKKRVKQLLKNAGVIK